MRVTITTEQMRTKKKEEGRERKMKARRRWERYREEAEREGISVKATYEDHLACDRENKRGL